MADLDEKALEAAARRMAAEHYADRFNKPCTDPHVQMNVDANWHLFDDDARSAIRAYLDATTPVAVTGEMVGDALAIWFEQEPWHIGMANSVVERCESSMREALRAALSAGQRESKWHPIETAPLNTPVDLWCIENGSPGSWGNDRPAGNIVHNRHKSEKYGWFGNQGPDGVPRGHMPDLIPVAWREAIPYPPVEMVEEFVSALDLPAPTEGEGA